MASPEDLAGSRLTGQISQQPVESGVFDVHLGGLPEDRSWFYYLAAGVAAGLMLVSGGSGVKRKKFQVNA